MTKNSSQVNLITVLFWLLAISVLDVFAGAVFLPQSLKEIRKVSNLNPNYNHGLNKNVEGFKTFGSLHYPVFTNSMGMFDDHVREVRRRDSCKLRILFIGDSFTEGQGYAFPQTFCGLLKHKLDSNKVEVLNAGVGSFSPKLYYLRTKNLLEEEQLKVDELFCFIDYSDIGDELVYEDFISQNNGPPNQLVTFWMNNSIMFNLYHKAGQKLFCNKAHIDDSKNESFIYWVKTNDNFLENYPDFWEVRESWAFLDPNKRPTLQHAEQLAFANMTNLKNLCLENHIKLTIVVYPQSYALLNIKAAYNCSLMWEGYAKKESINFISLYPCFVTDNPTVNVINRANLYIKGDSHWNAEGHVVVADSIFKYLSARGDTAPVSIKQL